MTFSAILARNTTAIDSLFWALPPRARRQLLAEAKGDIGALRLARVREVVLQSSADHAT